MEKYLVFTNKILYCNNLGVRVVEKIKKLINTEEKKILASNFFYLSLLQVANYILPLITFPYLVRVLGVEYFGILAFANATISYFVIITDYGFDLTATREISIHRDNKEKVIEIFSSVMIIKFMLMFLSFLLITILVFSFEKFSKDAIVYFLTFGTVVGKVLFPVWFFQGMERMKYITFINIGSNLLVTIAIFVFVQDQNDFFYVPLLTSIGFLVAGFSSLYLIKKIFDMSFKLQKINILKNYFIEGWNVFISRIFVSLYTTINIFLLGLFTNNTIVGYYSITEKIVNAVGGLFTPVNQTIYPYMAKMYSNKKEKFYNFIKKIGFSFFLIGLILLILFVLFANIVVKTITGRVDHHVLEIYYILIFTLITIPFGPLFTQILIIQKRNKEFDKVVISTFIFNLIISPISIYFFQGLGLAIAVVLTQFFVISLCLVYIKKGWLK